MEIRTLLWAIVADKILNFLADLTVVTANGIILLSVRLSVTLCIVSLRVGVGG